MEIRETQIEDILTSSSALMKTILKLDEYPRLIGRQIAVPSGRLDMLYAYQKDLFLIELKTAPFHKKFVQQVVHYRNDLQSFQQQGKLVQGCIRPFLLLPEVSPINKHFAAKEGVLCETYSPEAVLEYFYSEKLRPITSFVEYKPIDIGIWNIHLINKFIYTLVKTGSVKELQALVEGSPKSLYNKIKFAKELGLVVWSPNNDSIALSETGNMYIAGKDGYFDGMLSEEQAKLLRGYVQ